jgi:hypothetical protein
MTLMPKSVSSAPGPNKTPVGGDIDLLIHSDQLDRAALRDLRIDLQDALGAQHFDLVLHSNTPGAFARQAAAESIPL